MNLSLSDKFTLKKLLKFTMPSIGMMMAMSVYILVDGFFVSNFAGKTPFAAVNIIYPVLLILSAVGFMFGTGGTALIAKTYGEGDKEKANSIFSLIIYTDIAAGIILTVIGFFVVKPVAKMSGAEGELLDCCIQYAGILLPGIPFYTLQFLFQSFFAAAEKPKLGFAVTAAAGLTNMIGDAVLCTLLPEPYRLSGAAVATLLGIVVGGGVPLIYFACKNSSLYRLGKTRFDLRAIVKSCTNGSSEFISTTSENVVAVLFNTQLMKYAGENGVAAFGVIMYVSLLFSGAFLGYSVGSAPIISYHYGARNFDELKNLFRKSLLISALFGIIMFALAEILAVPISYAYVGYDEKLANMTVSGFRLFSTTFLLIGFGIFSSAFFTDLNNGAVSFIISFLRALVFPCVAVLILPVFLGINGIWLSSLAKEILSIIVSFIFLYAYKDRYHYV